MRRWLPATLKGQTTLVLVLGMLAVLIAGAAVSFVTLLSGHAKHQSGFAERAATLAAVADRLPPALRQRVIATARAMGLEARLVDESPDVHLVPDAFTDGLKQSLMNELAPLDIETLAVGHSLRHESGAPHFWAHRGPIRARLELRDGMRIEFAQPGYFSMLVLVGQLGLILLVVGGGLTALAVWAARRVTRPLDRFTVAAARLGTDVQAPLLGEHGPREVREASIAFNVMQRRIRRLLEDRTRMLAAIAHDLRTPIMRLRLRAEFLDDEAQRAKMEQDLSEMETMITGAIVFAREETAEEARARFDLAELLKEIEAQFVETGWQVTIGGPTQLAFEGRRWALKRAFTNLVENAVKYGGLAEIELRVAHAELVVTIEDRGPGIPEDALEQVFTPFYRVEGSRSRDTGGTGLGLAVARTVVRGHGGEITVANRPEGGLRQTVTLPRSIPSSG